MHFRDWTVAEVLQIVYRLTVPLPALPFAEYRVIPVYQSA